MNTTYMKPAWAVRYRLRGFDAEGMLTGWKWEGSAQSPRLALSERAAEDGETIIGRVRVVSWQPYRKDALEDTLRAVQDLAAVIGAAMGGLSVEPVLPPVEVEQLEGAKSSGGVGISASASLALTQRLDSSDSWLAAAEKVEMTPGLRADIDTFAISKRETDAASRTLNLYRIYDRYAREVLDAQPALMSEQQQENIIERAINAAKQGGFTGGDLERLKSALQHAVSRLRRRSRVDVLHEAVATLPDAAHITKDLLRRIDSRRGRVAHNPTVLAEAVKDEEADNALFLIVYGLLKKTLGL